MLLNSFDDCIRMSGQRYEDQIFDVNTMKRICEGEVQQNDISQSILFTIVNIHLWKTLQMWNDASWRRLILILCLSEFFYPAIFQFTSCQ